MTDTTQQACRDQTLYEIALELCTKSDGRHRSWKDWEQLKKRLLRIKELASNKGEEEIAALAYVALIYFIEVPK